jgi:serine/threonine protein kinase
VKVKLSDFGYCHVKDRLKLSMAWMSPEIINFQRFTTASDVFAFGVAMWECFTYGQIPWKGMTKDEVRFELFNDKTLQDQFLKN